VDFYDVRATSTSCATVKAVQRALYERGFSLGDSALVQVRDHAWRCRFTTTNVPAVRCRDLEGRGSWRSKFSVG
jgi:hypothetical protein